MDDLGAARRGRRPKAARRGKCKTITFHNRRGKPVRVVRCEGNKLKGSNKHQCRRGGRGNNFKAMQFVKCR